MKARSHFGVGIPSILMIFMVLCLTTFAILAVSTARADARMTGKNIERMQNYYQVKGEAEKKIAAVMEQISLEISNEQELKTHLAPIFSKGNELQVTKEKDAFKITFELPVSEKQILYVEFNTGDVTTCMYQLKNIEDIPEETETIGGLWQG